MFVLASYIYLPVFVQNKIIPDLIRKTGLPPQQISVRHIGLRGADFGPLRVSGNGESFLEIETVRIDYSPLTLWHQNINAINAVGVSAPVEIKKNSICMAGLCSPSGSTNKTEDKPFAQMLNDLFPVGVDTINIKKALLRVQWQNRVLDVPLDLTLHTRHAAKGDLSGFITLSPKGNTITATLTAHSKTNRADIALSAAHIRPQDFSFFWELRTPLAIKADANIKAAITIQLDPLSITEFDLSAVLSQARVSAVGFGIEGLPTRKGITTSKGSDPITIALTNTGTGLEKWRLTCSPLALTTPLSLHILEIQADILRKPHRWELAGTSRMHIPAQSVQTIQGLSLDRPTDLDWRIQAHGKKNNSIELNATGTAIAEQDEIVVAYPPISLASRQPRIILSLNSSSNGLKARGDVSGGLTQVRLPRGEFNCPGFDLRVTGTSTGTTRVEADLSLPESALAIDTLSARMPEALIKARMVRRADLPWQMRARVQAQNGLIQDRHRGLKVTNLSLDLPLQWPHSANGGQGSLSAGSIQWQALQLGGLAGSLIQQDQTLIGDFIHTSRIVPGLKLSLKTVLARTGARFNLDLPAFQPDADIDLGQLIAGAEGIRINGRLKAQADLNLSAQGLGGTARVVMDQGSVSQADGAIELNGITTELAFHQLPLLRSEPQQPIQVRSIQIGNIRAEDLRASYQIEPPNTVFIEKAGLKWCQGILNTQSIRVQPDKGDLDLTIFGNQLNLAQVLTQLGVAQGSGDGTVNGRIPLRWANGALNFGAGFLYSTPGQTGTIQLYNTETLLQGMPKGTPQYVQLDIASEALKDYTYNWAKVNLESQRDILKVSLKLDGKPNQLLPFAYDQQRGQFMRTQGQGQAEFKGIGIDLNFQSPLNQILHIKEMMTSPNI